MAVTFRELFESRIVRMGQNPSAELHYHVAGTNNDYTARITATTSTATVFDVYGDGSLVLWRESIDVVPIGDELWEAVVYYGSIVLPVNESAFSFDTSGGTQHITQSLATTRAAPLGKTAPDAKGAIGSTPDGVEGVDITVPVYQFSETYIVAASVVDGPYKATLYALTGRINDDTFRDFEAGEVLFLGAGGGKRGDGDWEIQFRFAASPNATALVVGDCQPIDKKGWDYLWVRYEDEPDTVAKAMVKRPAAVYVEKVYRDGDFDGLGIGS